MDFQTLFEHYYSMYRGESTVPATTDPEWKLAIRLYNNATMRMAAMDDTKWNFLFQTLQNADDGDTALVTATTEYDAPEDMQEPGGQLTLIDTSSNRTNYPVVQPHEVQGLSATATYGYFLGDAQSGFILHFNPSPTSANNGFGIDYTYYRKPVLLDADTEDGTSIIEGGDPAYYYNHMLSDRFRISRNYPSVSIALRDAEEALKGMKLKNNSGSYYSAWNMNSNSSSTGGWGM